MLEITTDKVAQVIVRARELEARTGAWELPDRTHPGEETAEMVMEALRNDPSRLALATFISEMNGDELAELVALMWVGRGSFDPEEWEEAVETAREEHTDVAGTTRYLLSNPLLAEHLEEGLERMGYSVEDAASGIR